jgi:REP element-mobilizing transposase RayT
MALTPDAPTARRARADIPWRVATRHEQFGKPTAGTIPTMIRAFKSAVTGRVNETQNTPDERVWQRNYYEHVIRDAKALYLIRKYIRDNPLQ